MSEPPRSYWTATDLMSADLPEPRFAVPGIVPEGLSLLVGSPKVGKSWAALGLAVAVASDGYALGTLPVNGGDVLYLALEDGPRRLQTRLRMILDGQPPPDRLAFLTAAPRVDEGLAAKLTSWADSVADPRLVIVDVLAKVRPPTDGRGSMYTADYAATEPLQTFATGRNVAVLVVHHTRKAPSDDFLATVSGTHGLAGSADAVLVLTRSRTEADAVLSVTGRDLEETNHALTFDSQLGTWRLLGDAATYALSEQRRAIAAAITEAGALKPKDIAANSGVDYEVVRKLVVRMADAGQLDTDGAGTYLPVPTLPSVPSVTENGERGEHREQGIDPLPLAPGDAA